MPVFCGSFDEPVSGVAKLVPDDEAVIIESEGGEDNFEIVGPDTADEEDEAAVTTLFCVLIARRLAEALGGVVSGAEGGSAIPVGDATGGSGSVVISDSLDQDEPPN